MTHLAEGSAGRSRGCEAPRTIYDSIKDKWTVTWRGNPDFLTCVSDQARERGFGSIAPTQAKIEEFLSRPCPLKWTYYYPS
jgi:hypothetical protein